MINKLTKFWEMIKCKRAKSDTTNFKYTTPERHGVLIVNKNTNMIVYVNNSNVERIFYKNL